MALTNLDRLPVVVGEQVYRVRSGVVDTADVKKGMVLITGATGAGYVQPCTAGATTFKGIALDDKAIGGRVNYVIPPCDVRVMLSESQTIAVDDDLICATITIAGVVTPGHVGEIAKPAVAAGAAPDKAEFDALVNYSLQKIGRAIEAKSTDPDVAKVLKIRI